MKTQTENKMEKSKKVRGLLNTTLKGIRIATGKPCTYESAILIMKGILIGIQSKEIAEEFKLYCLEQYGITVEQDFLTILKRY